MQVQAEDKWAELGEGRVEQCLDGKSGDREIGKLAGPLMAPTGASP